MLPDSNAFTLGCAVRRELSQNPVTFSRRHARPTLTNINITASDAWVGIAQSRLRPAAGSS